MTKFFAVHGRVDRESLIDFQIFLPIEFFHLFVELVGIASLERIERLEYAQCGAATEVSLVQHKLVASKRYHTTSHFDIFGT